MSETAMRRRTKSKKKEKEESVVSRGSGEEVGSWEWSELREKGSKGGNSELGFACFFLCYVIERERGERERVCVCVMTFCFSLEFVCCKTEANGRRRKRNIDILPTLTSIRKLASCWNVGSCPAETTVSIVYNMDFSM